MGEMTTMIACRWRGRPVGTRVPRGFGFVAMRLKQLVLRACDDRPEDWELA